MRSSLAPENGSFPGVSGDQRSCNLVWMDLPDPGLHRCADLGRQIARQIRLPLSHQTIVVVGTSIALPAQGIESGDELSLGVNREFQRLNRAVVLAAAADNAVAGCPQCCSRRRADRIVGQA